MDVTCSAYGLVWRLPFSCASLRPAPAGAVPDVEVADGDVPRALEHPAASAATWDAEPDRFLFRGGRRSGRFLVEGGRRVTLQRNPRSDDRLLALHFTGPVLAAALRQRGLLVLHAIAARTPGGVVVVAGGSGAGKSTTLLALLGRGHALVSDEITALGLDPAGAVRVWPGAPELHVWPETATRLGHPVSSLTTRPGPRAKTAVPASSILPDVALPLRALYVLGVHDGDAVGVEELAGASRFDALQECVFGPLLAAEHPRMFPLLAAVSRSVPVTRVSRPAGRWTTDEVVEAVGG